MAKEEKKEKKGFWKEFKEFITRGNVFDMAVGIIVGGAFTAIVNSLCNNILKPIINLPENGNHDGGGRNGDHRSCLLDLYRLGYVHQRDHQFYSYRARAIPHHQSAHESAEYARSGESGDRGSGRKAQSGRSRRKGCGGKTGTGCRRGGKDCGGFRGGCSRASGRRAGRTEKGITMKACGSAGFFVPKKSGGAYTAWGGICAFVL